MCVPLNIINDNQNYNQGLFDSQIHQHQTIKQSTTGVELKANPSSQKNTKPRNQKYTSIKLVTIAQIFKMSHKISELQNQLNNQPVFQQLYQQLKDKGYSIYFQGLMVHFSRPLQYYDRNYLVELMMKGQTFEARNDPINRQSLYFKEIKDFDKHLEIMRMDQTVQEHIKNLQKKTIQSALIDKENPLGFPIVQPLKIQLKISKQESYIEGILKYHLGKIRLISLNKSRKIQDSKQKKQIVKLGKFPLKILNGLKDFVQDLIPSQDIQSMIVLSKISSQVSDIQQMKKLHKIMACELLQIDETDN